MEDQYYDIQRRTEIKDTARELRRKYLRYKDAELVYSILNIEWGICWNYISVRCPFFLFPEKDVVIFCIQLHKVVRSSANKSWMFEGIGGNHQQVEQSELSGHRHCLPICF